MEGASQRWGVAETEGTEEMLNQVRGGACLTPSRRCSECVECVVGLPLVPCAPPCVLFLSKHVLVGEPDVVIIFMDFPELLEPLPCPLPLSLTLLLLLLSLLRLDHGTLLPFFHVLLSSVSLPLLTFPCLACNLYSFPSLFLPSPYFSSAYLNHDSTSSSFLFLSHQHAIPSSFLSLAFISVSKEGRRGRVHGGAMASCNCTYASPLPPSTALISWFALWGEEQPVPFTRGITRLCGRLYFPKGHGRSFLAAPHRPSPAA